MTSSSANLSGHSLLRNSVSRPAPRMSRNRYLISALLSFHLIALVVSAVPPPEDLASVDAARFPQEADIVSRIVTPILDTAADGIGAVEPSLFYALRPLRSVTRAYTRAGLGQRWTMFVHPSRSDQYVRLDYFVSPDPLSPRADLFRELVLPVDPAERLAYFRGKSIRNSIRYYHQRLEQAEKTASMSQDEQNRTAARRLATIARFYRERLERDRKDLSGRVVRTEMWYALAPSPPPGQRLTAGEIERREMALAGYRNTRIANVARPGAPRLRVAQPDADLTWVLLYVDSPEATR